MHHSPDFPTLTPAKAKAAALALFAAALASMSPDWRAVAFALHAAFAPKPKAAKPEPEADGFEPWEDYTAGRAAMKKAMGGRVVVTFADGWSRSVNVTNAGGKGWRIAAAVRFAITCWRLAAVRRVTGSDSALYHSRGDGLETALDGLVACPEIVSVVSDDGTDTEAGELTWSADRASRETANYRAGRFTIPNRIGPNPAKLNPEAAPETGAIVRELMAHRTAMIASMGHNPNHALTQAMHYRVMGIASRVAAFLYPDTRLVAKHHYRSKDDHPFGEIIAAEPMAYPRSDTDRETIESCGPGMRNMPDVYGVSLAAEYDAAPVADEPTPVIEAAPEITTTEEPAAPSVPAPPLASVMEHRARLCLVAGMLDGWQEPHPEGRDARRSELEAVFPPLTMIENPAPLALPAPAPVLLLTGPKLKPRYSFIDGAWVIKAAA